MFKKLYLLLVIAIPVQLFAQTNLHGTVYDYENKTFPLQKVAVRNLTNNQVAVTTAGGQFTIPAKKGDLLTFALTGYHIDTLYITDVKPITIYLPGDAKNLNEVAIVSAKISPYLDLSNPNAEPSRRVSTDGLEGKENTDRAGGLQFALGYGKYKREQEKVKRLETRDEFETEINANFNERTITELIKLKGKELKDFMVIYRPTVAQVSGERPFNYSYYIAQAHQTWLKLTPEQRKMPPMQRLKRD